MSIEQLSFDLTEPSTIENNNLVLGGQTASNQDPLNQEDRRDCYLDLGGGRDPKHVAQFYLEQSRRELMAETTEH